MKLARPFCRLPVRFDVSRLRTEIEALPADAWSRHPGEYEGNTAARLITVGGTENDAIGGEMRGTAALTASPYLQQVLATFNTVWSRSRLMRIAAGGAVPEHSDMNRHWFHRVRVHIPVITRPEVRFFCGDQSVHMAAGEAWVFDNWRRHRVLNPTPDVRIHLVADTMGTSAFWRIVEQGQTGEFDQQAVNPRFVGFDPEARPRLLFERFNFAPLMSAPEVEQLAFDLVADLAPADQRPESASAVNQFGRLVIDFCHDWRSHWSVFGDAPEARAQYEQLVSALRQGVGQLPPVPLASTGYNAQTVLNSRLLAHLFGGPNGARAEAAEFNVAAGHTRGAPATRQPRAAGSLPATSRLPVIDRPLIVLSAPRAGSTLLFETLAQAPRLHTIGGESHRLIESIDALRPGYGVVASNRLTAQDATPAIVAELRRRFAANLRDRDGEVPPAGASVRMLEKTPKNALRVPFLLQIFPDARFIFLQREPRANLSSMMEAWRAQGWVTYRRLAGWSGPWSLLLPPGYERLRDRPLEEIVAFQWQAANATILDDLAIVPRDRWTSVRYEDLIRDPHSVITKLLEFAGLSMDERLAGYLSKPLPPSRHTQTRPDADKWKRNATEIERVLPSLGPVSARLEP